MKIARESIGGIDGCLNVAPPASVVVICFDQHGVTEHHQTAKLFEADNA